MYVRMFVVVALFFILAARSSSIVDESRVLCEDLEASASPLLHFLRCM